MIKRRVYGIFTCYNKNIHHNDVCTIIIGARAVRMRRVVVVVVVVVVVAAVVIKTKPLART